ncbi:hypothetical protein [Nocardiopsis oceani]
MPDRPTIRPGAVLPEPSPPPSHEELRAREEFKSASGCAGFLAAPVVLFLMVLLPEAVPLILVALIVGCILAVRWYRAPQGKLERHRQLKKLLAAAAGRDYVTAGLLTRRNRPLLRRVQSAVDTVLESPLHRRGQLLDTARNTVVLRDLEWQIAADLHKASSAERELNGVGAPRSDQEQANLAHRRAVEAINSLRAEAGKRVAAIQGYAARVRKAQHLLEDMGRIERYDRIANEILAESAGGRQQDEALASLEDAQRDALRIARLHEELGL